MEKKKKFNKDYSFTYICLWLKEKPLTVKFNCDFYMSGFCTNRNYCSMKAKVTGERGL
jgi:hypothetical protein